MGLPQLLDALKEQAAVRRASEMARADAEVREIRARARAELEHRRAQLLSAARREAEGEAQRAASVARKDGAEQVLVARSRLLERVRGALERRIERAADLPEYVESLPREVKDALDRLPPGSVVVRAPPELVSRVAVVARERDGVRVEPDTEMGPGFTVASTEHGVEVDGTLQARLQFAWPRLAVSILADVER